MSAPSCVPITYTSTNILSYGVKLLVNVLSVTKSDVLTVQVRGINTPTLTEPQNFNRI